jgi:hypothetical protein
MQLGLFNDDLHQNRWVKIQDGTFLHIPNFFKWEDANEYYRVLLKDIEWNQETMIMYGRKIKFPRLTAWYGDNDKAYSFSGLTLNPF